MKPSPFAQANRVFSRPVSMTTEECGDLHVFDAGTSLISRWDPTPEERAAIAAGGPVWLHVIGRGHPPVALSAESPFEPAEATQRRGLPEDLDELSREAARLAQQLSAEIEVDGSGWAFALFLFREAQLGEIAGHVVQISRDRERTKLAVARWLKDLLDGQQAKARG